MSALAPTFQRTCVAMYCSVLTALCLRSRLAVLCSSAPRYVLRLLSETKKIFEAEATLVDFNFPAGGRVTVFGDVHGQFYDLLNVFQLNGYPSETNPCVFNGDFVDRYVALLAEAFVDVEHARLTYSLLCRAEGASRPRSSSPCWHSSICTRSTCSSTEATTKRKR